MFHSCDTEFFYVILHLLSLTAAILGRFLPWCMVSDVSASVGVRYESITQVPCRTLSPAHTVAKHLHMRPVVWWRW